LANRIQIRRDTLANWTSNNPILANGEISFVTDLNRIKVGDGTQNWLYISYLEEDSLALKANLTVDLISTSASAYTLQLADAGKLLTVDTSSGSVSVEIPTNDSQAFPTGTVIALNWVGAATAVTITAASGVTLNSTIGSGSPVPLSGRYAGAQIYKIATNTWIAVGSFA
jgi:hypothetical protein